MVLKDSSSCSLGGRSKGGGLADGTEKGLCGPEAGGEGWVRAGCVHEREAGHVDSRCRGRCLPRTGLERSVCAGQDPTFTSVTVRGESQ